MNRHLSEEEISGWVAGERGAGIRDHLNDCAECSAEVLQTETAIAQFSVAWRNCAKHGQTRAHAAPLRTVGRWGWAGTCAALAVVVLLAVMLRPKAPAYAHAQEVFQRIPYVVPPAPYERTQVVRMDVPVAALIAAGLRLDTAQAGQRVRADVLVGQDDRPLAVGFPESEQ